MKYTSIFLILLLAGCHTKPKDFTLVFTVESVSNYKIMIEIMKDKTYQIRQQNIFFDIHAGRERINTSEGTLTEEEYAELSKLVASSRLFKMKDTYGFDKESNPDNPYDDVLYQLICTEGKKTKYISIRSNENDRFSEPFLQLIRFLNRKMSI